MHPNHMLLIANIHYYLWHAESDLGLSSLYGINSVECCLIHFDIITAVVLASKEVEERTY